MQNKWAGNMLTAVQSTPMTLKRGDHVATLFGDMIFVMGGRCAGGGATNSVETFNTKTNVWSAAPPHGLEEGQPCRNGGRRYDLRGGRMW